MTHFLVLILRKRIKRKLTFSFATDFVPNSGYLSDCDLSTTKIIISNLEKTINQEIKEYEWGGGQGRIYITSRAEVSDIEDIIYEKDLGQVVTKNLLELMLKWKNFLLKWTKSKLEAEITRAFVEIKNDKIGSLFEKGTTRYEIKSSIEDTRLHFVIEDDDFRLSPSEYFKEVVFDNRFIADSDDNIDLFGEI